jgi:uncharacterized protein (DUF885 family)
MNRKALSASCIRPIAMPFGHNGGMATMIELADEMLELLHDESPLVPSVFGIPGYDHLLPDLSVEADRDRRARAESIAERAAAADGLSGQDAATRAVVVQQATSLIIRADARAVEHTLVFPLIAPATSLLHRLALLRPDGADAERAYLTRLAAIPGYLDTAAARHRAGLAAGRLPLAYLGRAAVDNLDRYLADADGDPLGRPPLTGPRIAERTAILDEVVRPAFARYRDVIAEEIAPHGRPEHQPGLCWLPDGEATYAALVRMYTTTERTPEALHQTGLDLVARLTEEYAEIGSRAFGARTAAEVFERLRTDPALRWDSADELLAAARETIARAERAAPNWFGRVPAARCVVAPVPPNEEQDVSSAYYVRPALDGSRPGTYFANTYRATERDRFTAEAVAFHEAVPGHHFQLCLAQELDGLPMLRRLAGITAYTEGWALYTERLADEMGLYSSDITRLGMLAEDSVRATRLVVDTGLHAMGWTRQQVVDYLRTHTLQSEVDVQAETDRYIEMPAQALSYMVGRLEIQRLRTEAEHSLGPAFDIKDFHDLILSGGPLPMTALADAVAAWATRRA